MTDIKHTLTPDYLEALGTGLSRQRQPRVAIAGGPRTGKTTAAIYLAEQYESALMHTDDLIHHGWSEASAMVADWLELGGQQIVEGVAVPRAIRKWLKRGNEGKPIDALVILSEPFEKLTDGQARMAKGVATVLEEIRPELEACGVVIVEM